MAAFQWISNCRRPWSMLLAAATLVMTGCDSGGYSGPTGTVQGTVTLNAAPVPGGCRVVFVSTAGFTASGDVNSDGKYRLAVAGKGDEVPVATYNVSVVPKTAGGEMTEEEYNKLMEQGESAAPQAKSKDEAEEKAIPAKYHSAASSGLSFEVKAGENTIDIPLE